VSRIVVCSCGRIAVRAVVWSGVFCLSATIKTTKSGFTCAIVGVK
jgi:hypothetical protein